MKFRGSLKNLSKVHKPKLMGLDFFKYIGPGLLVTVGFIDPGNWATNVAAGAKYGYPLLFIVTLGTLMLIILQHNAAHLGIVTGYCLSETSSIFLKPWLSRVILYSGVLAAVSTAFAEILGGAIALQMLVGLPIKIGSILVLAFVMWMLYTNSYKKLEKWIISFVSIVGISFVIELCMVHVEWGRALISSVKPVFPKGSMVTIMSVLGAVVMPHNLFLHSEIIQSRQWNLKEENVIESQLKYEFMDTFFSMMIGWAINSAMILVAAAIFFTKGIEVTELNQAQQMLRPLLGSFASIIFAVALLMAGLASCVTAGMAGGSIFAGLYKEPYDIHDNHTKLGVAITVLLAAIIIFFIRNPFHGLIYSQMLLSIQLPVTVFLQIYLTSSKKVMGRYANAGIEKILLWLTAAIVAALNIMLVLSM
jgi:manganese transport protein